jgi:hypothetical protein
MSSNISYQRLSKVLESLGFRLIAGMEGKTVFKRDEGDVLVVLPERHPKELVSPTHLTAVKHTLSESGVISPMDFISRLEKD